MIEKFKYTEIEFDKIAHAVYRLMTNRASAITDLWPAFKCAQSTVNPVQKYSINSANTRVMKELKRRVDTIFAEQAKKSSVPKEIVVDSEASKKADDILTRLFVRSSNRISTEPKVSSNSSLIVSKVRDASCPTQRHQVNLLTGNVIESESEERAITIVTKCPKKFVIVDLETGEQWSSIGVPINGEIFQSHNVKHMVMQSAKIKATRRVAIPKPVQFWK